MTEFEYIRAYTIEEACEILSKYKGEVKILAGGTDLIVALRENHISLKYMLDIKKIKEMNEVNYSESQGLSVGGAVCLNDMVKYDFIYEKYPILIKGAKVLANSLLRNRATLMGNLCNASPAGDMIPASLMLEGEVEAVSVRGKRRIALKDFFLGVKKNALKSDELAVRVIFPPIKGTGSYKRKARIKGHDLAQIGSAAFLREDGILKIAVSSAAPRPVLIQFKNAYTKEMLKDKKEIDKVIEVVLRNINPISDQRASREYRIAMAKHLTKEVLKEIAEGK